MTDYPAFVAVVDAYRKRHPETSNGEAAMIVSNLVREMPRSHCMYYVVRTRGAPAVWVPRWPSASVKWSDLAQENCKLLAFEGRALEASESLGAKREPIRPISLIQMSGSRLAPS